MAKYVTLEQALKIATERSCRRNFIQLRGEPDKPEGFPPLGFLKGLGVSQLKIIEKAIINSKEEFLSQELEFF